MNTVREYYMYRNDLKTKIRQEKNKLIRLELKSELKLVEKYIKKMENEELNEYQSIIKEKNVN